MNAAKKAVVVGGGTGAPVSIGTLLAMGFEVSAVVAMADDGGSTGILRERAGAIPPGDIRKCLVAMASDPEAPLVKAFKYRFDYANDHALGNLMITALNDTGSTFPEAIAICERILDARGHVYPSTLDNVRLCGRTRDGRTIIGQNDISHSDCALARVFLDSTEARAYEPALDVLRDADLIVLGPGSLFTSIIPNLLVPGVVEAIHESHATTVFVCSIADVQGETWGLNCAEHVEALLDHGMRGRLDFALVNDCGAFEQKVGSTTSVFKRISSDASPAVVGDARVAHTPHCLQANAQLIARIKSQGPRVIAMNFVKAARPTWHEPAYLQEAFAEVCRQCHLPLR